MRHPLLPLIVASGLFACGVAVAQQYPTKTITIVVPNAPGGQEDLIARLLAPEMSKILGQPVIVKNKPGADTMLGSAYVAKEAPADGYTIAAVPTIGLA